MTGAAGSLLLSPALAAGKAAAAWKRPASPRTAEARISNWTRLVNAAALVSESNCEWDGGGNRDTTNGSTSLALLLSVTSVLIPDEHYLSNEGIQSCTEHLSAMRHQGQGEGFFLSG